MMPCIEEMSSDIKTLVLTVVSLISVMNLDVADRAFLSRVFIYIGQVIGIDATIEEREAAENAAQVQMKTLEVEIASLNKKMDELKKSLKTKSTS